MERDYHVHSNYSDGSFLHSMLEAAERAGLEGVGVADHCNVSSRTETRRAAQVLGFNLDVTYERRRRALRELDDEFDLEVYDAVEMDYHPTDETAVREFLDEAGFDYAIGSVHELEGVNVHAESYFASKSRTDREAAVDRYFDHLVSLVESDLFDIAAHLDLVERNPALRGLATEDHYRAVAAALADSRTVPEVNAGRALEEYGELHPAPDFLAVLREYDVPVVLGTDAHKPTALEARVDHLREVGPARGLDPVDPLDG